MSSLRTVAIRPLSGDDHRRITWALSAAIGWDPEPSLPPIEVLLEHPVVSIYHEGWGRHGDLGVIAEVGAELAFCRLLTDDRQGHGFVDATTPELGVAVVEALRGKGIGTLLMNGPAGAFRSAGIGELSLSVEAANPARRLYKRPGYREVAIDRGGVQTLLDLTTAIQT